MTHPPDQTQDPRRDEDAAAARTSSGEEKLKQLQQRPSLADQRYRVDTEVGRGGMGAVFRVEDLDLGRNLAMKVILGASPGAVAAVDPQLLQRFLDEAQITGQLDHPGVVPVHELGIDSAGRVYFTMRLVRGTTADEVFAAAREGRDGWTRTRALEVILKVCDTMAFAHKKGVLHRDLKPANVMVGKFGEVYVMDWGLAKVLGEAERRDLRVRPRSEAISRVRTDRSREEADSDSPLLTMDGAVVGTPCYMAPEQADGRVELLDQRADVYAIGAMLYELATGQQPYVNPGARVNPYAVLAAVQAGPPKPIHHFDRTVPAELVAVCEKAMHRELERRYVSARELAEDLRAFLEKRVVRAYRTGPVAEMAMWVRRNRGIATLAAGALASLVAGIVGTATFAWRADERAAEVAALNVGQKKQLTEASWSAFHQADRLFAAADEIDVDPDVAKRNAREALLFLSRAIAFDPGNRVAWERFGWECTLRFSCAIPAHVFQHQRDLRDVHFSPDGARLWSASDDGVVNAWDVATGRLQTTIAHGEWLNDVAFSPEGTRVVTAGPSRYRVWSTRDGSLVRDGEHCLWVVFAPDGATLLAIRSDNGLELRNAVSGARLVATRGLEAPSASFSPDGSRLVTPGDDHTAKIWDTRTGDLARTLPHADQVLEAVFGPDGKYVATRGQDRSAAVWDATTGKFAFAMDHDDDVSCMAFGPDGATLATGSRSGGVRLWEVPAGRVRAVLPHQRQVVSVEFSPDGTRLLTTSWDDDPVKAWDAATGALLWATGRGRSPGRAEFSADGVRVVLRAGDQSVRIHDARTGRFLRSLDHLGVVVDAATSPNADQIATAGRDDTARLWSAGSGAGCLTIEEGEVLAGCVLGPRGETLATWGEEARLWDTRTGRQIAVCEHGAPLEHVLFSPDGARVVTVDVRGACKSWQASTGALLASANAAGAVHDVWFGPDGRLLVIAAQNGVATVSDGASGAALFSLPHPPSITHCLPDRTASRFVVVGTDGFAAVWDAGASAPRCRIEHQSGTGGAALSPDGATLVAFTQSAAPPGLYDAGTGELTALLEVPESDDAETCEWAVFSPDGRRVLTVCSESLRTAARVRVWDARTGRLLASFAEQAVVDAAVFHADGERVLTWGSDLPVRVWDAGSGELLASLSPGAEVMDAVTSDDGSRIAIVTSGGLAKVWHTGLARDLSRAAGPADVERALAVAELLTGQRLSATGELSMVTPQREADLRAGLQSVPAEPDALTPLVRWLASHGPDAPAFPGATVSRAQRADALIEHGGASSVREALELHPAHPLVHLALGPHESAEDDAGRLPANADAASAAAARRRGFLLDHALRRLPNDAAVWARAAEMLLDQEDEARALQAASKALAIDPANAAARGVLARLRR